MHTGPQHTGTPPPTPGGGRGGPLLVGVLSFALVFLLIVGATVAYLVLRPSGLGGAGEQTTTAHSSAASATGSASPEPTEVVEQRCYSPEYERTSTNPSGKLRGGGLQFIPPAEYSGRGSTGPASFLNDTQIARGEVEKNWYSSATVGLVQWQPGIDYPGNEAASQRIAKCLFTDGSWGGKATERTWDDEVTKPVTVAGMPGYETTAVVNFGHDTLERTDATAILVVVLEADEGPSALVLEHAVGVTEHEEAAEEAYESLTGLGS
ncbi:hypothetical protein [Brachybacterium alimentarium]|uniref:Uncharacterized protein n=1 Tax=Brachybacterium alimentarium TaxID=47845 RepID=A0A2A3YLD4_9MICO|nr:hypothetical protein [Brachybacterium alimentarium]PCC40098.1 hypothetical protein CIK66_05510 [Brachybacterium alimentarium]RCS69427.1 hypothetical protein CIK73_05740 [Brachybacterium alimentarium]RCS82760.1 hypothetical protein CIK72_03010 [Brachybacterium alimentarium]